MQLQASLLRKGPRKGLRKIDKHVQAWRHRACGGLAHIADRGLHAGRAGVIAGRAGADRGLHAGRAGVIATAPPCSGQSCHRTLSRDSSRTTTVQPAVPAALTTLNIPGSSIYYKIRISQKGKIYSDVQT